MKKFIYVSLGAFSLACSSYATDFKEEARQLVLSKLTECAQKLSELQKADDQNLDIEFATFNEVEKDIDLENKMKRLNERKDKLIQKINIKYNMNQKEGLEKVKQKMEVILNEACGELPQKK